MRVIDWEKPVTAEDENWVNSFGTRNLKRKIQDNKKRFKAVQNAVSDEDTGEDNDEYDSMKAAELKEEAKRREGFDMTGIKTRTDLVAALRKYDAEQVEQE